MPNKVFMYIKVNTNMAILKLSALSAKMYLPWFMIL